MNAPVTFKDYGIEQLIEKNRNEAIPDYPIAWDTREFLLSSRFTIPNYGLALYHQSSYKLNNFTFSAGIRLDYEHTALTYHSSCDTGYSTISASDGSTYSHTDVKINDTDKLSKSYLQILPKVSVTYSFGAQNRSSAYLSAAKGYKAGGFNTQMFSDVLQQRIMGIMGLSKSYEIDEVVGYKPEQSWNFEAGIHWESNSSNIIADVSIFYIDCNDQQTLQGVGQGPLPQQDLDDHKGHDDDAVVDECAAGGRAHRFHFAHSSHLTLSRARTCPAGRQASPAER